MADVLLVDDEERYGRILARVLQAEGHRADHVASGTVALERVKTRAYDVVVSDIRMPGMGGVELVEALREASPGTDLALMTAFASVETAVAAIRLGVRDYLLKPFPNQDLVALVNRLEHQREALSERRELRRQLAVDEPLGNSPPMQKAREDAARLAESDVPVLLRGETGAGKEVFARYLHACSLRREAPFLALNVAALPEGLLEAELFGVEKGAYTGAEAARPGKLEAAGRGTLLLDEVGEVPLELQAKLLRVLEAGEYRRLGETRLRQLQARVLAATHRDLEAMVREGSFREDLYYRLNVADLVVPPLRERPEDLEALAAHLLARQGASARLDEAALEALRGYTWPGNVRELSNVLQRAALLCRDGVIRAGDLRLQGPVRAPTPPPPGDEPDIPEGFRLEAWELDWVRRAMEAAGGVKTEAARLLGISRRQLDSRLRRLDDQG